MRWLVGFWMALVLALSGPAWAAPARIAFVYDGGESTGPSELRRGAELRGADATVDIYAPGDGGLALTPQIDLAAYDLVFLDGEAKGLPIDGAKLEAIRAATRLVVVGGEAAPIGNVPIDRHPDIARYWANRSVDNDAALIGYLTARVLGRESAAPVAAPIVYPEHAFYHPAAPRLFAARKDFLDWYASRLHGHAYDPAKLTLGLSSNRIYVQQRNTAQLDALIAATESKGHNAVALLRKSGVDFAPLLEGGKPMIDVLLFDGELLDNRDRERGQEQARSLGVPMLMALSAYRDTPAQYRASNAGIAPELTPRVVNSEREGLFEPIVVAGKDADAPTRRYIPMPEQVEWRVTRALAWARLHRASNAEKKIVFTYWSEAGGKADVGGDPDDFLDVQGTLATLLPQMKARGYDLGTGAAPTAEALAMRMARGVSNVGSWAPGELASRVGGSDVALVAEAKYLEWYRRIPAVRRAEIEAAWGPPPGKTMTYAAPSGERFIVIPKIEFGNVLVAPHPMWGYYENEKVLLSKDALPPHHQYLAFFLWLQNEWKADAWVSLFSNITLQPGKSEGPLADDHIGILLGGLPHIHPERLGASGGMSTKRKAMGLTAGWYNIVVPSDAAENSAELRALIARYRSQGDPVARAASEPTIRKQIEEAGLSRAVGLDADTASMPQLLMALDAHFNDLEAANVPWGGKILGTAPDGDVMDAMVTGMLGADLEQAFASLTANPQRFTRPLVHSVLVDGQTPAAALVSRFGRSDTGAEAVLGLASDYADRLRRAPREVEAIFEALEGRWLEPGPMGEPFRRPDVLPPGRSLFNFDQRVIPTIEAQAVGVKQADALIAAHRAKNDGTYPDKLAFVLWSGEIAKNNGVTEAQVLHLLGTRPTRNWRGEVVGVELIERKELGRPRVDVLITTSGVYRDHFQDKVELITQAARLAATSPESDNPVAAATREAVTLLVAAGETRAQAERLAAARVFSPAPGAYSPSIQFLAKSGDQRGDEARMADLYTRRLSHAYGGGLYGTYSRRAFEQGLRRMDAATLPRSSDVNGLLDQPMAAGFLGGLNLAAKALTGRETPLYISNLRAMGNPTIQTAQAALQTELSSRYFNPKWLRENQAHGYDGARNFMFLTDNLDLWDSTATEMVSTKDWSEVKSVFVDDKFGLDMDRFFDRANPHAQQMLLTNLLGAAQRGYWRATPQELTQVARRLTESVRDHGPACEAGQCRNQQMTANVARALAGAPGGSALLAVYRRALGRATDAAGTVPGLAPGAAAPRGVSDPLQAATGGARESSSSATPAPSNAASAAPAASASDTTVTGRIVSEVTDVLADRPATSWMIWFALAVSAMLLFASGMLRGGPRARTRREAVAL